MSQHASCHTPAGLKTVCRYYNYQQLEASKWPNSRFPNPHMSGIVSGKHTSHRETRNHKLTKSVVGASSVWTQQSLPQHATLQLLPVCAVRKFSSRSMHAQVAKQCLFEEEG
eukprot:jgi/Ulvmu1/3933/UM018_0156.1